MNTNVALPQLVQNRLFDYNNCFYKYNLFKGDKSVEKNALRLLSLISISDVSKMLGTSIPELYSQLNYPKYKTFSVAKKNGGERIIHAPEENLMKLQSKLNDSLQNYYQIIRPKEVNGFVINSRRTKKVCNIVENAKVHVKQKYVLNIDLRDFFPSIKAYRVKDLFLSEHFKFNTPIANALALLVTYNGALPIGAPTSPVLSNFICLEMDYEFSSFCNQHKINYSRYADDLTFSSNNEFSNEIVSNLKGIISKNGFVINFKKKRLQSKWRKQTVTGLVVNEKVNIDRKQLKKIRAVLFDASKNGINLAATKFLRLNKPAQFHQEQYFMNYLRGYINFIGQVRGVGDPKVIRFKWEFANLK